jgi:hypothetical protein
MAAVEARSVWVLVPGDDHTILVASDGSMPLRHVELDMGETTIGAVRRRLLPDLGHPGPILDCYIVQPDDDADPAVPVPVLLQLAQPPAGWRPPARHRWSTIDEVEFEVEPGIGPLLFETLDVRRGLRPPDPLRPKWTAPDWFARASTWIERTLVEAGLGAPTEIVQYRHWGISALMQVATDDGRYWFKAVFPYFAHEPGLTATLDELLPGSVARVIGVDADEGWLLMEHIEKGEDAVVDPTVHREPVAQLVDLQRRFVGRDAGELAATGWAVRPLAGLPEAFASAIADPVIRRWVDVSPERIAEMVTWLRSAVAEIDAVGVPDTLVHGDFHPNNVLVSGGRHVIFDWSDAAYSHPFLDVGAWSYWFRGQPAELAALWESFYAAWDGEPWLDAMRAVQPTFEGVVGAYHFVSYAGIVAGLDVHRRPEHAGGLAGFFKVVDAVAPSSHAQAR